MKDRGADVAGGFQQARIVVVAHAVPGKYSSG